MFYSPELVWNRFSYKYLGRVVTLEIRKICFYMTIQLKMHAYVQWFAGSQTQMKVCTTELSFGILHKRLFFTLCRYKFTTMLWSEFQKSTRLSMSGRKDFHLRHQPAQNTPKHCLELIHPDILKKLDNLNKSVCTTVDSNACFYRIIQSSKEYIQNTTGGMKKMKYNYV